jgi:LmbE family N-acetylglucosaminyl deacetylase
MSTERRKRIEQSRKVLVVAPHPDDETLGCGGLIAKLADGGASFLFVFVTDGSASHPGSKLWPRERLAACRKAEAEKALHCLGVDHAGRVFLALSDSAMPSLHSPLWEIVKKRLSALVQAFLPDLALLPWRRDPHCDHRASWHLAWAAFQNAKIFPLTLEYAIWLDESGQSEDYPGNDEAEAVVIDVSRWLSAKRAAVAAHQTQTTGLIHDDPTGFRLTPGTIARLVQPTETFWWPLHAGY